MDASVKQDIAKAFYGEYRARVLETALSGEKGIGEQVRAPIDSVPSALSRKNIAAAFSVAATPTNPVKNSPSARIDPPTLK